MHTYVFICDCVCVHMRETEQPSRKTPHVSLRTKVTMQDREKTTPHKQNLPQKTPQFWNRYSVECKVPQTLM